MKNLIDKKMEQYLEQMDIYVQECDVAKEIIYKLKDIPKRWEVSLIFEKSVYNRLLFVHHSYDPDEKEADPLGSFLHIVTQLENKLNIKLNKRLTDREYLIAEGTYCYNTRKDKIIYIEVRQFQVDTCEIEYIEKKIRVPKPSGYCKELLRS